jgi:HAD superfamily phosphoserine phosphatase-like hydrolase
VRVLPVGTVNVLSLGRIVQDSLTKDGRRNEFTHKMPDCGQPTMTLAGDTLMLDAHEPLAPVTAQRRPIQDSTECLQPIDGKWSAIVLAGQRPGIDPLARIFSLESKACVPIKGKPMATWVIETLLAAPQIGNIIVLAQDRQMVSALGLVELIDDDRVTFAESVGGISQSIAHIVGKAPADWPVLVTTADHPLLTVDMVNSFIDGAGLSDLSVAAVERRTVLQRYPASKRTWLKFKGGAYSGANLFALRSPATLKALELWAQAEQDRKKAFKLFWHFGPRLALRAITRTISFPSALRRAGQKLGLNASLVLLPQAEAAIDVDKISDHEQAELILSERNSLIAPPNVTANTQQTVSIFDLDRTLTKKPTYTALLAFMAWHVSPWRLLTAPIVLLAMLGYLCGLYSRARVKEIEQWLLLGNRLKRADVEHEATLFADRLDAGGFYAAGKEAIAKDQAAGRRIILATAANQFYAAALADRLGITEVIATQSVWRDDHLTSKIAGENCYGLSKCRMAAHYLTAQGLSREDVHIRFYSDHISDLPTFEWADEQIAVNPSPKLYDHALGRNWPVLFWA